MIETSAVSAWEAAGRQVPDSRSVTASTRCWDPTHRGMSFDRAWDECWRKAHAIHIERVPNLMGEDAVVGLVVDDAIGELIAGRSIYVPELIWQGIDAVGGGPDRIKWSIDEMVTKATRLVDLWEREVRPKWRPVYAHQLELHWRAPWGVVYHVHLDDVFDDGSFTDIKTSEQRLAEGRAHHDFQLSYYAWAMYEVFGIVPPSVGLDGLIYANPPIDVTEWNPRATKPWWDRQRSVRTLASIESFREEARKREDARSWAATTGIYLTQGITARFACNGCPVIATCPAWAGLDHGKD